MSRNEVIALGVIAAAVAVFIVFPLLWDRFRPPHVWSDDSYPEPKIQDYAIAVEARTLRFLDGEGSVLASYRLDEIAVLRRGGVATPKMAEIQFVLRSGRVEWNDMPPAVADRLWATLHPVILPDVKGRTA